MTKKILIYSKKLGWHKPIETPCWNCGEMLIEGNGGHFVPPSCGDEGFYACKSIKKVTDEQDKL
jgi:predicted RNA-binding Zn-ribbon protein involved in translation (DUF1610 family)